MKIRNTTLLSVALLTATVTSAHAAVGFTSLNVLTSTSGKIRVYEGSDGSAPTGTVFYGLDILLDDPTISIYKYAVSYTGSGSFAPLGPTSPGFLQSPLLGANNVIPLFSGTYDKSLWGFVSPIPFESLFGTTDNSFILIGGAIPITRTTDIDGPTPTTFNPSSPLAFHAFRSGMPSSQFVAFNAGGQIIAASAVPEPSVFLCSGLALVGVTLRRRRI